MRDGSSADRPTAPGSVLRFFSQAGEALVRRQFDVEERFAPCDPPTDIGLDNAQAKSALRFRRTLTQSSGDEESRLGPLAGGTACRDCRARLRGQQTLA